MKKQILVIALAAVVITGLAFKAATDNSAAKAVQQQGIYIFMYSTPESPYEYLGTVEASAWVENPQDQINSIFKRAKKKYPDLNGIIFHIDDPTKVDAIRFK